jgi:F0F1-type ATP synthase assembly protein I
MPIPNPRELGRLYAIAQVGLEMVAPIALGLLLDYQFGWMPWATIAGAVLGFVGGMAHLLSILNRPKGPKTDTQRDLL